jgi:hypothetical protein
MRFHIEGEFEAEDIDDALARLSAHFGNFGHPTQAQSFGLSRPRRMLIYPVDAQGNITDSDAARIISTAADWILLPAAPTENK